MENKSYNIVDGFNTIAPGYDLANDAMTFGMHRKWRGDLIRRAAKLCPKNGTVLDLATGTGDVAIGVVKHRSDIKVTAVDPAEGMMAVARKKVNERISIHAKQIDFEVGDARKLRFEDNSFDVVTISWGIRNVRPFSEGLREILRVLKPGGHLLVLESGRPEFKLIGKMYQYYSKLLPYIGGRISGYKPAYQYYVQSADTFPSGKQFIAELLEHGFSTGHYSTKGVGLIFLYQAQKPVSR